MQTVPGIPSAQRFITQTSGYPPSLAMYSIVSEAVFSDPYYLSVHGMGEWTPLIETRYYRRNLLAGLEAAPLVAEGSVLVIADRDRPDATLASITWLRAVGLDMSTTYRGIVAVDEPAKAKFDGIDDGIYVPAST